MPSCNCTPVHLCRPSCCICPRPCYCSCIPSLPLPVCLGPVSLPSVLFPALFRPFFCTSTQAIEKKGSSDVKDWAEYWVVLSTFYVTQWAIDFVLCWLPFYYIAKLGFILALWHPSTRVAQSLYQKVLSPLAITYEADIDRLHQDLRVKTAGGC